MAVISSNGFLNFANLDFGVWTSFEFLFFRDEVNNLMDLPDLGISEQVNDALVAYNGTSIETSPTIALLYGTDFAFDESFFPTSGTVGGALYLENGPTAATSNFFYMTDLNVSLVDLISVAWTPATSDDSAMLRQILSGADTIIGSDFDDSVATFGGDDLIRGGKGSDTEYGGLGNDTLVGAQGDDFLNGNFGDDALFGGNGADTLIGSGGKDLMYGGVDDAVDVFVFDSRWDSKTGGKRDKIYDFVTGTDKIDLSQMDADVNVGGTQGFGFSEAAHANSIWTTTYNGNTTIWADVTGDTSADFSVRLMGVTDFSYTDLLINV